jgi:hypothetical protein
VCGYASAGGGGQGGGGSGGEGAELGEGAAAQPAAGEAVEDAAHGGEVVLAEAELRHVHEEHGPAARGAEEVARDVVGAADRVHAEGVAQHQRVPLLLQHPRHRVAAPTVRRTEPLDPRRRGGGGGRGAGGRGDGGDGFVDLALAGFQGGSEVLGGVAVVCDVLCAMVGKLMACGVSSEWTMFACSD